MTHPLFQASGHEPVRVVIAGGGVAGLEALRVLRNAAPMRLEAELLAGRLASVDTRKRLVMTREGTRIGYDALLVAVGANCRPALSGALTVSGARDAAVLEQVLGDAAAGTVRSIAFALPPRARWSLPLYELALMTAERAAALRLELRIEFVTHERAPLAVFGPRVSAQVRSLLAGAGVRVRTNARTLVAQPGRLFIAGGAIAADRVIALGSLVVPSIDGLPQRHRGFIAVDEQMRVEAVPRVYAAGAATWYPQKTADAAAHQARLAAASIVTDAGLPVPPALRKTTDADGGIPLMPQAPSLASIGAR